MKHKDNFKEHKWKWIVYATQNPSFTSSQQETYDKHKYENWKMSMVWNPQALMMWHLTTYGSYIFVLTIKSAKLLKI